MDTLLPVHWYIESPIDFEHKQYVILSYLQGVDSDFIQKKLSPHLLHMENLVKDMILFEKSLGNIKTKFNKHRYVYVFDDNTKLIGEDNILIEEVHEIVHFSIPLVRARIDLGYNILRKVNQVLY